MHKLKVLFLGTGNAFNTGGRGSQSIWIGPEGEPPFLVDAGPTALAAMERERVRPSELDAIFFTHVHGDHTAAWPFILLHGAYADRREKPLHVFGAPETRERLDLLARATYPEILAGGKLPFAVEHHPVPVAKGSHAEGRYRFDTVPLVHHETSIGYRFRLGSFTVGVSGDTAWCPGVEELARGCDLLIIECTSVAKAAYAHVSVEELREGRPRLGAARIAAVHLSDEVEQALKADPIPDVVPVRDGETWNLEAG